MEPRKRVAGRGRIAGAVLTVALALALALAGPAPAAAETEWLCLPGFEPDPCAGSLETTVRDREGGERIEDPAPAADPPLDCFYVYPTVSNQPTPNASKARDPEVVAIAEYQAARFSRHCSVYAPIYRQQTILGLQIPREQGRPGLELAYSDVLEAWETYLREHNDGRGVILIGHSQGTGMLTRLVREEIDPRPRIRRLMASALLLGANVTVAKGSDRGGVFEKVPACERRRQLGCVIAFSTFDEVPPDDTRFGVPDSRFAEAFGFPTGDGVEALCTNPADLARNRRGTYKTLTRTEPFPPGAISLLLLQTFSGSPPSAATPWVRPADRYSGRCRRLNGAHVLKIRGIGDSKDLDPAPDDTWGLHIIDVNIALGNLVKIVRAQSRAYEAKR